MKRLLSILLILVLVVSVFLCSCGNGNGDTDTDTNSNTDTNTSTDSSTDTGTDTDKGSDTSSGNNQKPPEPEAPSYDTPIEHNLKVENSVKLDIFDSEDTFGNEGNTSDYTNATMVDVSQVANGKTFTITEGGIYRLYGKTENGQILVNLKAATKRNVVLVLDNLQMTSTGTKAVIYVEKCENVNIIIPANTTTTLKDTPNNLEKGVIHVRSSNLTIDGKGTLNIDATAAKSRGIFNTKTLTIEGGIYNVNTAYSHGIQGEEGLVINGGKLTINSAKSGLKTGDFDEDKPLEAVVGALTIAGGSISVNSKTNGISAYGTATINNGRVNITSESDGIDVSDNATFNGGIVSISAKNDSIKSDNSVNIASEANLKLLSGNDGIDAITVNISTNGVVYIKTNIDNDAFVLDENGTYIWKNGRYQEVDPVKYPDAEKYKLESCKGIKADGNVTIENASLGIESYEDAIDGANVEIKSGKAVLYSNDDGIDIAGNVTIDGTLEIMYSNKGIKAAALTINEKGLATIISTSDAVDSPLVTVNGGTLFLLEKLDLTDGKLVVNGGTVIAISSTKKAVSAVTSNKNISISQYPYTTNAVYGNWLRITDGENSVALRLPKSYQGKMSVTCISEDISEGTFMVELGTYQVGDRINNFVYEKGEFTALDSIDITLE